MKLIAIETATGKQFPVRAAGETWILVQTGKQSYVYEKAGERYTLHVSTCMFDKHRREILDVDRLRDRTTEIHKVLWDGYKWIILPYMGFVAVTLTPELAATMEVIE